MPRILIVDDDEQIRSLLRMTLEEEGFEIEEAADGIAALRVHKRRPVDLAIVDIIMPEKDGLATILELRKATPAIKVIAISGGGLKVPLDFLPEARALGADRTFSKPIERTDLLKAVRELLAEE